MVENKISVNDKIKGLCTKIARQCKRNPYLIGLILGFVVLLFVPASIWFCYFLGDNGVCLIRTSLSVGDALGFYGTVLSFIGTTALGVIAVWQNKRLQHLEEVTQAKESSCSIYIRKYVPKGSPILLLSNDGNMKYKESHIKFEFSIENHSDAFLTEIEMRFGEQVFHSNITLSKGEMKNYYVFLPQGWKQVDSKIDMCFTSCYGVKSYGDVDLRNTDSSQADVKYYHFYGTSRKR